MTNCPGCGQDVDTVAMVDLVYLYVPQGEELVEQPWHTKCYIKSHCGVTCAEEAENAK